MRLSVRIATGLVAVLASGAMAFAQRGRFIELATPESFDGGFNFCRIAFSSAGNGFGNGWSVDYSGRRCQRLNASVRTDQDADQR